jgi:hypothetical protein
VVFLNANGGRAVATLLLPDAYYIAYHEQFASGDAPKWFLPIYPDAERPLRLKMEFCRQCRRASLAPLLVGTLGNEEARPAAVSVHLLSTVLLLTLAVVVSMLG